MGKKLYKKITNYWYLIFYKKYIIHIIQSSKDNCKQFIKYSKTQKIDVDSKGNKCKEKMMKILYNNNENINKLLFDSWNIVCCNNKKEFENCINIHKIIKNICRNIVA